MWMYVGDLELALAREGRHVVGHTPQPEVYNFWNTLSESPRRLYEILLSPPFRFEGEDYYRLQDSWHRWPSSNSRAALFFLLSTASELGLVSRGALDTTYVNAVSYSRILCFKKPETLELRLREKGVIETLRVIEADDYAILNAGTYHRNRFDYGKNIGPEEVIIDHKELRTHWEDLSSRVFIVYNYHPDLLELYKDSHVTMITENSKPTQHEELCKELIIAKR